MTDLKTRKARVLAAMQRIHTQRGYVHDDARAITAWTRTREQIIAMQDSDLSVREVAGALRSLTTDGLVESRMVYFPQGTSWALTPAGVEAQPEVIA